MRNRLTALGAACLSSLALACWVRAQAPSAATARVETAALDLTPPDRYAVPIAFEPGRRVAVMAMDDGVVRSLAVPLGSVVREGQEIVQLDRTEAAARLKIAQAELKEAEARQKAAPAGGEAIAQAEVDVARGKVELAQIALDRCTLRAPFPGRVLAFPVSQGQYVAKGTSVAEIADVTSLRVLLPVDRTQVKEGGTLEMSSEGRTVAGKVQTLLPLPEAHARLRELATPWSAAWVAVANPDGKTFEPGQRVLAPFLPVAAIGVVPGRAIAQDAERGGAAVVKVVRNDFVTTVPVRVLGVVGPDRTQVSGAFRQGDVAIVESSTALADGTFLRFSGEDRNAEAVATSPAGASAAPAAAGSSRPGAVANRVAPLGAPDSAAPKMTPRPATAKPAAKGAAKPAATPKPAGGGVVPF